MRVKVLASGSTGNCTYIETNDHKILIDVGISKKMIDFELSNIGVSFSEIDTLLITHEHDDHIKSLGAVLRKSRITCYMTGGTYNAIVRGKNQSLASLLLEKKDAGSIILLNRMENSMHYPDISLDSTDIIVLPTFHDAVESVGYKISSDGKSVVYITDTGYVHNALFEVISNAWCYILECNHDPHILMCSERPYSLKMRILSDHGHLSNEDAFVVLAHVMGIDTRLVFYAHISLECNLIEIVEMTRKKVLGDYGIDTSNVEFVPTSPIATKVFSI